MKAKSDQGSFGDDGKGSGSTVRKRGGEQSTDSPRSKKQVCTLGGRSSIRLIICILISIG